MRLLITAGNTVAPIDAVRGITNIFSGRTGARIAVTARHRQHRVTFLTSRPEALRDQPGVPWETDDLNPLLHYSTFDEFAELLEREVRHGGYDAIVHAAAVSDYRCVAVHAALGEPPLDPKVGKIKSDLPELWLKLERTPKLIDQFRRDWGFAGTLVKFKLEVGLSVEELLVVAERSRLLSQADIMVANSLESMRECAYLGPIAGAYEHCEREHLAEQLLELVEAERRG